MRKRRVSFAVFLLLFAGVAGVVGVYVVSGRLQQIAYPQKYAESVQRFAAQNGLEENLVYAIIRTESGFSPTAKSSVDARGLMQITEETFAWIKTKIAPDEEITFDDLYTPEVNIRFGCYLLAYCMERYGGDVATAAAAYHSGVGTVDSLLRDSAYSDDGVVLHTFPYDQMRNYVHKVTQSYVKYQTLYASAKE